MDKLQIVRDLWSTMDEQNWDRLASYFSENAAIYWPNTREVFNVTQFVMINKEYPGSWKITVDRLIETKDQIISVVKVSMENHSFHAVSFFNFDAKKINQVVEYWGEDGLPPNWRAEVLKNE